MKKGIIISMGFFFCFLISSHGQSGRGYYDAALSQSAHPDAFQKFSSPVGICRSASLSDTLFVFDDGSAETGWVINPGNLGWLGNYFPVSPSLSGHIDTLYVWFLSNSGGSAQTMSIDVFDSSRVIKGSTPEFLAEPGSWISVPAADIPFAGPFYVMVKWENISSDSHYLGYDETGLYSSQNLERYRDFNGTWTDLVVAGGALPGVFLVRVRATSFQLGIPGHAGDEQPLIYPNPAKDNIVVSLREEINSVKVVSTTGILQKEFYYSGETQVKADLSSLPAGVYLVSVCTKSGTTTSRVILLRNGK
jgi:hypothetical protein